ncbi:MAG TPA: tRNA preQ1(34) S-adenosylmethionine ribosyltransferase-isomerase QueA [Gammaproteobacteria bacterium]|jgi:S-adenosylmethionine:tRNA ribosyltransferase-isomerase|nr:tRNA preQ1(34) S-adenosylmethionine ribosyltransferase-isomerase QueA [Arenicellales bacterium]MDP6551565.1 tRNA preQ1(34) S-adenosylmethionine ribosyltransferase-isomerase QueA [Arenicellales bacterium]MDP6790921.1 tRNA preQ1(34) S-adenosylmethionine ribosyltransferase-isomerase QueA [Arenicellales bacterium]MDP6918468.1 tRNA preQ1(34) S-adenosylmethionine ribosyltransferase-isomerase QueA [Arenicellales bacterium]HCX86893.1 tRNA preQ1(34) S-adenosylmethionine ribosyltransferase-isomerase Q|tara:strand:- start:26880 stop:27920 length:1041 start_codon:yes stop_codon:yes gene_type:complete
MQSSHQYDYDLPGELIAQSPKDKRSASRLLIVPPPGEALIDGVFSDLVGRLRPNDLLVVNDTKVLPARLYGRKTETGGKFELLLERLQGGAQALVQIRASRAPGAGTDLTTEGGTPLRILGRDGAFFLVACSDGGSFEALLYREGETPLPPYIQRPVDRSDSDRYQTVYAKHPGAVAAPTAGLHFDEPLLDRLTASGVGLARLTLHVGAGTFAPIKSDSLDEHQMHAEEIAVDQALVESIRDTRRRGGRVVAVGTTVVRALEAAAQSGELKSARGETRLFIRPGYAFQVVDMLITNFHLPRSTLMVLVSAFAGVQRIREAYAHAVANRYRFFSYGDAMLVQSRAPQ